MELASKEDIVIHLHYGYGDIVVTLPAIQAVIDNNPNRKIWILYPKRIHEMMAWFTWPSNIVLTPLPSRGIDYFNVHQFMLDSPEWLDIVMNNGCYKYYNFTPKNADIVERHHFRHFKALEPVKEKYIVLHPITCDVTPRHSNGDWIAYREFLYNIINNAVHCKIVVVGSKMDYHELGFFYVMDDMKKYANVEYKVGELSFTETCELVHKSSGVMGTHSCLIVLAAIMGIPSVSWLTRDTPFDGEFISFAQEYQTTDIMAPPWKVPMIVTGHLIRNKFSCKD